VNPPAETSPLNQPPPPAPPEARKRLAPRLAVWLIALAVLFGITKLDLFADKPGPTADAVETAIADNAQKAFGITVTVECPDDADETEVNQTFVCTVTDPEGESMQISVTNRDDTFSWPGYRLRRLA
jgi:Domain of unknown function (DUF4333)